jgi:hypothetical protein
MKTRISPLILAGLAQCSPCPADELIFSGPSMHWKPKDYYNNFNYGISYVNYEHEYATGIYHNSFNRTSIYFGRTIKFSDRTGLILGGVTGYKSAPVIPAIILTHKIPITKQWDIRVSIPPGVINLGIGFTY